MNIKHEVLAFAVRLVAENTNLIHRPTGFESLITDIFGEESYDHRMARNLEVETQRAADAIQRVRTSRQFKKITTLR